MTSLKPTFKYKVIFDEKHNLYKIAPNAKPVPEKYKKDLEILDLYWDYDILYRGIEYENIIDLVGYYHLYGENALYDYDEKNAETIMEIYSQPREELNEIFSIISDIMQYPLPELKNSTYSEIIR